MRISSCRCHLFEYTLTMPAPWAVELPPATVMTSTFGECLFVTVAVEQDDAGLAPMAAELIRHIAQESTADSIVIDGRFCPTTRYGRTGADFLSELADALDLLAEITELAASAAPACLMPFGWQARTRSLVTAGSQARQLTHLRSTDSRESVDYPPNVIVLPTGIDAFSMEPREFAPGRLQLFG